MDKYEDDPRKEEIERVQVYGIWHPGVSEGFPLLDDDLIYVGATTVPLKRRLDFHRYRARDGSSTEIYQYIREEVEAPREDLDIEEIPYDSEAAALNALSHTTLNSNKSTGASYDGYDWTSEELDRLERLIAEENLHTAQQALEASPNQVRNAALHLGLIEGDGQYTHIDWEEWDHLLGTMPDATLAEKIGCSEQTVQSRRAGLGIEAYDSPLSESAALEVWIAHHLDPSQTYAEVAERVGCEANKEQVGRIVREETFADVDKPAPAAIQAADTYEDAREAYLDGHDCVRSKPSSAIDRMGAQ